jgi:uncharacterized protein YbjT (DUF2867 family)
MSDAPVKSRSLILVTGATGRQGGAVARHLLRAGFPVRALARTPSSPAANALRELGAAGVHHFVQASVAGSDAAQGVKHFECKGVIERYVDELGLPRTFLGEVFYMDNFADPKEGGMILPFLAGSLRPETRLHMIAVDDIGAIATVVFENPGEYLGRKIDIAGDRLTVAGMRDTYHRVTGRRARRWAIPGFVARLISGEMVRQLRWNNDPGWRFGLEESFRIHPGMTTFERYLRELQPTHL